MFYMIIMWICLGLFFLVFILNKFILSKRKVRQNKITFISGFLYLVAITSFIIALVTKDPVFEAFGVSESIEWWLSSIVLAFAAWKFYLNPLKSRVIETEKDVSSIKSSINSIGSDINLIKNNLIRKK